MSAGARRRLPQYAAGLLAVAVLLSPARVGGEEATAPGRVFVNVATISGSINPASSDYLQKVIARSADEGAAAVLVELDTPGGLLASTKDVIQAILNARVPVIVYVAPQGAWAGSAGTFITLAGHVAAMAPGTSIGAAHPVGIGAPPGTSPPDEKGRDYAAEKAENFTAAFIESIARERKRNVDWAVKAVRESVAIAPDEALRLGVIDLVATDRTDLLTRLDGRELHVAGSPRRLALAGAELRSIDMTLATRFFDVLANPDIAVLLILAGILGLYVELTTPGVILPGVTGAACLVLGFISLQILPFSWLGLMLLFGGIALLVAELFVTSFGLLFALGVACFLLGGSMLFDRPLESDLDVSFWTVLVPAVVAVSIFGAVVIFAVGRTLRRAPVAGVDELVGRIGRAVTALEPEGTVFVRGEHWTALATPPVPEGSKVEIVAVEGMRLRVRPAPPDA
ncbi:MAG: nodulation protein NfeD [Deltaproteobacteria bacterium]|nr:nodulation protein NfeD [Deltaproteobacteria bacterium]